MSSNKNISFTDVVDITYITKYNSDFKMSDDGFLELVSDIDKKFDMPENQGPEPLHDMPAGGPMPPHDIPYESHMPPSPHFDMHESAGKKEPLYTDDGRRNYKRVFLHCAFPFENPYKIISVQDRDGNEIGIIEDVSDFDEKTCEIIKRELKNTYFVPEIKKILSFKSRFGFASIKCVTNCGPCEISLRDPFRSITKISPERLLISDTDGNRYSIKNVSLLDKKSYRAIELYL